MSKVSDWWTSLDAIKNKWDSWVDGSRKRDLDEARANISLERDKLILAKQRADLNKKDHTKLYVGVGVLSLFGLLWLVKKA